MKYMKRSGTYVASNVSFDPVALKAYSYGWWCFLAVVEGKLIFNNYRYSNSTSKHQRKILQQMRELNVVPDLTVAVPAGLPGTYLRYGQEHLIKTLADVILAAEEHLCDEFLESEVKRQERNEKAAKRRKEKKLQDYLENQVHFRDYDIVDRKIFADPNELICRKVAVHQIVNMNSLERDVENALYSFHRDGFGSVVFYV